jgi:hypothetical protein
MKNQLNNSNCNSNNGNTGVGEINGKIDKQQYCRRLKRLKPTLDPTQYQFILWVTNQKWNAKWKWLGPGKFILHYYI